MRREHATDTAFGPNDAQHAGIGFKLPPKSEKPNVNAVIGPALMNAPHLQKMPANNGRCGASTRPTNNG